MNGWKELIDEKLKFILTEQQLNYSQLKPEYKIEKNGQLKANMSQTVATNYKYWLKLELNVKTSNSNS